MRINRMSMLLQYITHILQKYEQYDKISDGMTAAYFFNYFSSRKTTIFLLFSLPIEFVETPSIFWISEWIILLS